MGASQVTRSRCGSRIRSVSCVQIRILDPRVRERLGDEAVEERVAGLVDGRALVGALQVDRVDGTRLRERLDQLRVPLARRVELEAQLRVALEQARDRVERRRVLDPQGDDEVDGLRLAPHGLSQRRARLAQGEVERRALVRPAAVVEEGVHPRPGREERHAVEELREAVERVASGEREGRALGLQRLLILAGVGDVLADSFVAAAAQVDHRRAAHELRRCLDFQALQLVGLDLQREVADEVVGRHSPATVRVLPVLVY